MQRHQFILLAGAIALSSAGHAQQVIPLWDKGAPGFESRRDEPEQHQDWWYKNIHNPSLTVFLPPQAKGNASIEAHIYAQGKHAFNMGQRSQYVSIRHWPARLGEWLEDRGYSRAAAP